MEMGYIISFSSCSKIQYFIVVKCVGRKIRGGDEKKTDRKIAP